MKLRALKGDQGEQQDQGEVLEHQEHLVGHIQKHKQDLIH